MRTLSLVVRLAAMLGCLGAVPAFADWKLERDVEPPSYAVIEPENSDLNIDSVVLACEETGDARVLQLQIYLSADGPLLPKGAAPQQLKDDPRAEIEIDGRVFPVGLLFADTYAVLADETDHMFPRLSERLIDAMVTGRIMVLRFDLLTERAGQPAAFDGEAVIALQAGEGATAVSAVRRPLAWPASGMTDAKALAPFWTRDKDALSAELRCGVAGVSAWRLPPDRLDLNDVHIHAARQAGVKLAISTDAHSIDALQCMRFGIDQARRGWLTSDDVINTRPLDELRGLLKRPPTRRLEVGQGSAAWAAAA